jgi:hypothetical protein
MLSHRVARRWNLLDSEERCRSLYAVYSYLGSPSLVAYNESISCFVTVKSLIVKQIATEPEDSSLDLTASLPSPFKPIYTNTEHRGGERLSRLLVPRSLNLSTVQGVTPVKNVSLPLHSYLKANRNNSILTQYIPKGLGADEEPKCPAHIPA